MQHKLPRYFVESGSILQEKGSTVSEALKCV